MTILAVTNLLLPAGCCLLLLQLLSPLRKPESHIGAADAQARLGFVSPGVTTACGVARLVGYEEGPNGCTRTVWGSSRLIHDDVVLLSRAPPLMHVYFNRNYLLTVVPACLLNLAMVVVRVLCFPSSQ